MPEDNLHYYSERKSIINGAPQNPVCKYGSAVDMEYQFLLFCANSVKNQQGSDLDCCEWGSIETGMKERRLYYHEKEGDE